MTSLFKEFLRAQHGGVAMMAGFAVPLIFLATVASVEATHQAAAKLKLQNALDAAVINCATKYEFTREAGSGWRECAGIHFDQFIADEWPGSTINSEDWDEPGVDKVRATMNVHIPPLFNLLPTFTLTLQTQANVHRQPHVEIALVLDISRSMEGTKFTNMQSGALDFVTTLYDEAETGAGINVSVIPFGDTVRFPTTYRDWLEPDYVTLTPEQQADPDLNPFFQYQESRPDVCENGTLTSLSNNKTQCVPMMDWNGCFTDQEDTEITSRGMPISPDYLPDINLTRDAHLPEAYKHVGFCPNDGATALFLESDEQTTLDMISGMNQDWEVSPPTRSDLGWGTGTDTALSWAWRILHPSNRGKFKESSTLPAASSSNRTKHIVILSDGQPIGQARNNDPLRTNTASGNLSQICQSIRNETATGTDPIHIWSIAYGDESAVGAAMQNCNAGDGGYYFAGTENVSAIFQAIARDIIATRAWISG